MSHRSKDKKGKDLGPIEVRTRRERVLVSRSKGKKGEELGPIEVRTRRERVLVLVQ